MHYKDGREVRIGDVCKGPNGEETLIGVVVGGSPGASSCNLYVQPLVTVVGEKTGNRALIVGAPVFRYTVTASDFEFVH
jgi:hypothetical protein